MHKRPFFRILICTAAIMIISSCSGGDMGEKKVIYNSLENVPNEAWEKLSEQTIYFGHQSVGNNIIDGIKDVSKKIPSLNLNILELSEGRGLKNGVFVHSRIGANSDYNLKINDFLKVLDSGVGEKADIVALKFCYLDVQSSTDISKMFETYRTAMETVHNKFPKLKVVHFTVPLTVSKTTWRTWLKKLLGKTDLWEYNDNIKRNEYNKLLIEAYVGKESVLNIAEIESTKQDGSRQTFEFKNMTYYSLFPEYTNDGGHLNEIGRVKAAEQFLLTLVNLS